ncbi:MFS transporter [Mycetocola tolaasinivorans]|uniref:MFS transporter n=1 Tax=Mycetocola tolaasinivorans TaxID=76635 RepID=A0A3L7A6K7_9MICO|nr:MFS transporter [Mycetocola tolaasinivorans]RLP75715.1 MFS transporter [Mycetocola tolaasinivorans]
MTTTPGPGSGPTPGASLRAPGGALAILAIAQLIISLDINIVFVALPDMASSLGFSAQNLQWVVSAYTVVMGGFMLLGGRASDILGQKRVFILALWIYAIASLIGGFAWSPEILIGARVLQGLGGALLFPATLSLVNSLHAEGPARNRALAIWGGAGASGLTLGSLAGGVLTDLFGWAAVFFVNVPLAGIVALLAWRIIPIGVRAAVRRGFDIPGAITITAAATLAVFALVQAPEMGWSHPSVLVGAALAIIAGIAFALIERRAADPLVPAHIVRNPNLIIGSIITFLYMGTFGAIPYFMTTLFQTVLSFTPLQTGLAFLIPSAAIFVGTQIGGRATTRFGPRPTLILGAAVGLVGTAWFGLTVASGASLLTWVPGIVLSGLGQGIVWTAMWVAVGTGTADEEQGTASGIGATAQNTGNAIGLAVFVAIGATFASGGSEAARVASGAQGALTTLAALLLTIIVAALFLRRRARPPVSG